MTLLVWCVRCQRVYHVDSTPGTCPDCDEQTKATTLQAYPLKPYYLTVTDRLFLRMLGVRPEV